MGTFFRSVAARTGDRNSVESLLITWLSAKGFEPMAEAPLFQLDGAERGLCLFSKKEWVVVLYSQMETEGQRLIHELGKLDVPLLETWVHDSDIWGYDLYQQQELVASFNSDRIISVRLPSNLCQSTAM